MNKIRLLSAAALLMTAFSVPVGAAPNQQEINAPKILIAYYSYSGNTKEVAEAIQKQTGGDLFEIKAEGTYPASYREMTRQVQPLWLTIFPVMTLFLSVRRFGGEPLRRK